jgi:crotonobetainyl-CoA:carnitine CoA-transferase CaiB-like acyl-CoA transferase
VNRNKRAITLDLKDPAAIAWLKGYLAHADVLVQNLRPGVMDEIGLDAASLMAANPRLIYCSLWAFGAKGPMKMNPGYEPMVQAFAGLFSVNGAENSPTARVGMQVLDMGTGIWAALGCLAALMRRHTTGQGCVVDTSLFETALGWLTIHYAGFNASGELPTRDRGGNQRVVVFQAFDTADGEVVIAAANDRLFAKLARALGHPEWGTDPRLATNALRVANRELVIPPIEAILRTQSMTHWVDVLEAAGVPCAPINDLRQVAAQPQTEAIGIFQNIPGVDLRAVGLPISFDGVRPPTRLRAPTLGEHNAQVGAPQPAAGVTKEST